MMEPFFTNAAPYLRTPGGLDFVAIDLETANSNRSSVCAVGIAIVEDGRVVQNVSWLIKPAPPFSHFDGINVFLHGITPEAVANAPTFDEVLPSLLSYIDGRTVVAHNAAFDIGAIREACIAAGLDWPHLTYACSLVLSRRSLDLLSYRLPLVCDHLGIALNNHHDAGSDAEAAARVVMALTARSQTQSLEDLAESLHVRLGTLTPIDWASCIGKQLGRWARPVPPQPNPDADPDHLLYHAEIVFTGGLSIVRSEAWALAAGVGAMPAKGVTKRTRFLVIGDGFAGKTPEDFHTGKAARATTYRAKGIPIEVLTEPDLWKLLADTRTSGTREQNARTPAP